VANLASRKIVKLQIWVEYLFGDADRKRGATKKIPVQGVTDLLKLPASMPSESPDLTDGIPHSLCVEATYEGGHTTYCEIGQIGGAFGGLTLVLDEMLSNL
jgi:hypothetical protein